MIDLALITARGGSVGLPRKNIMPLAGVPLIQRTVNAAIHSEIFARVIVSTNSVEIADCAKDAGAEIPFLRSAALASSSASSVDVVLDALGKVGDTQSFALLQPTSPFLSVVHLREAAKLFEVPDNPFVVSVVEGKPLEWCYAQDRRGFIRRGIDHLPQVSRRQDATQVVYPNGAIYMAQTRKFRLEKSFFTDQTVGYQMNAIDSIDVDMLEDFNLAEAVISSGLRE